MSAKKFFSLFNIKEQMIKSIETFKIDPQELMTDEEKRNAATRLIDSVARLNGAIALQPLPFADILLLTPIQVSLVVKIARIYGRDTDSKVIQEVLATVIKGLFARTFARSLIKFIPFAGLPVAFLTSYVMTHTIGITAIKVFEGSSDFNLTGVKERFEKEYQKIDSVNIVITTAVTVGQSNQVEVNQKSKEKKDLKTIEGETKNTVIYLPYEN